MGYILEYNKQLLIVELNRTEHKHIYGLSVDLALCTLSHSEICHNRFGRILRTLDCISDDKARTVQRKNSSKAKVERITSVFMERILINLLKIVCFNFQK